MKKFLAWILIGMLLLGGALGTCACKKKDSKENTKIEKSEKTKKSISSSGVSPFMENARWATIWAPSTTICAPWAWAIFAIRCTSVT